MLAQTLKELERDGLVSRSVRSVVPPHVDYSLTPLGRGVADHIVAMLDWIGDHVTDVVASQRNHDAVYESDGRQDDTISSRNL